MLALQNPLHKSPLSVQGWCYPENTSTWQGPVCTQPSNSRIPQAFFFFLQHHTLHLSLSSNTNFNLAKLFNINSCQSKCRVHNKKFNRNE